MAEPATHGPRRKWDPPETDPITIDHADPATWGESMPSVTLRLKRITSRAQVYLEQLSMAATITPLREALTRLDDTGGFRQRALDARSNPVIAFLRRLIARLFWRFFD